MSTGIMVLVVVDDKAMYACSCCKRILPEDAITFPMYDCRCGATLFPDLGCMYKLYNQLKSTSGSNPCS